MPLTILRGDRQVGYAGAIDALARYVARQTRYPRRDAMLLMQGDFTDPPALVPEFAKRFEGGADIVVGERDNTALRTAPLSVRRLVRATPWLLRFFVGVEGIRDLTSSFRLIRISVLRDLLRNAGEAPVCAGDTTTANVDLLLKLVPLARRVEAISIEPTWDVRLRDTRVVALSDGLALVRWGWRSRGRRAVPSIAPESTTDAPRSGRSARNERDSRTDSRAELRVESARNDSRHDSPDDALVATEDYSRTPTRDRARGGAKPARPARNAERNTERNTERNKERNSEHSVVRIVPRIVPPDEARNDTRDVASASQSDDTAPIDSTERPTRRKRSRGRRGDRKSTATDSVSADGIVDGTIVDGTIVDGTIVDGTIVDDAIIADGAIGESAPIANGAIESVEFNGASLSSALIDAETDAELDAEGTGRTRPVRKKRRRRGGRGRNAASRGVDAVDGATSAAESNESVSLSDNDDDATNDDSSNDTESNTDDGSSVDGNSAETRVQRRGRRGRRGGSRRARQYEGSESSENESGGEANIASPPPGSSAPPIGGLAPHKSDHAPHEGGDTQ